MDNLFKDVSYERLDLIGIGLTKAVYINEKLVDNFRDGYDWGSSVSNASRKMSEDILTHCLVEKPNKDIIEVFSEAVIQFIPTGNFRVLIDLKMIVEMSMGIDTGKNIHAHTLMSVFVGELNSGKAAFVSKLLDLPNLPYKNFNFGKDSIEYKLLNRMDGELDGLYKKYLSKHSRRSEVLPDGSTEIVEIQRQVLKDEYVFTNGLGTGEYLGTPIDGFEIKHLSK